MKCKICKKETADGYSDYYKGYVCVNCIFSDKAINRNIKELRDILKGIKIKKGEAK